MMPTSSFTTPIDDRYFEDYVTGAVHEFGSITVDAADIVEFGRRFDPQPFHVDVAAADASTFGGLVASGFHTTSLLMRLIVDHYLSHVASLGSPGADELRWLEPVRPGDTLSVRATVLEARRSRTKPDRGLVNTLCEVVNQRRQIVMSIKLMALLRARSVAS